MSAAYQVTADGQVLRDGHALHAATWTWHAGATAPAGDVESAKAALGAVAAGCSLRHVVVGVIGPRDASSAQCAVAEAVGAGLAEMRLTMICGGKSGVMEAACRGHSSAGGAPIGILPGHDAEGANPFVAIPLPTGLSEGRNMVIAKAARVLIAVGGSYGTLSEVAYGLHFGKAVIGVEAAPRIDGVHHVADADAAIEAACAALLDGARVIPSQNGHRRRGL